MAVDGSETRMYAPRQQGHVAGTPADVAALGKLVDRYLPPIYAFVARRVADRATAESLTATALERGFTALVGRDVDRDSLGGFLYRVAATAVVDESRRGRRAIPRTVRASDLDLGDDRAIAESIADEAATRAFAASIDGDRLRRALIRLPDGHRRVLLLKYFDGLAPDEMCAALACSRATLDEDLHLALHELRVALDRMAGDAA
jgi:RNA polymerase sigma-70 factor (ECF subfamily)